MGENRIGVAIIGSTGSIGVQTLEVIDMFQDRFKVVGLTTNRNIETLVRQISRYKPKYVYIASEEGRYKIKKEVSGIEIRDQKEIIKSEEVQFVVIGVPGFDSVEPTIEAVKAGKRVAVASKEAILCGGKFIFSLAESTGAKILPIDSEHSSLWKILNKYGKKNIKKIYITASGGPFLNLSKSDLENVKVEDALKHPVWRMGEKITIDSANLMNKAFEIIEASYLFDLPVDIIAVKVHPEAIIHSAVEYRDGTMIMSAHYPDMRIPIMYSLLYDREFEVPFSIPEVWGGSYRFMDPDTERFPAILLGWRCSKYPLPCVLVSADDIAVNLFLQKKIRFTDIFKIVDGTITYFERIIDTVSINDLGDVLKLSKEAKRTALKIAERFVMNSDS